jgi:glycosyltransferase involved in cell wall biosynthesis
MGVNLINEMVRKNIDAELVVADRSGELLSEVRDDVEIYSLDFNIDTYPLPLSFPKLIRYLDSSDTDIVLSLMKHANITAALATNISNQNPCLILSERNHLSKALEQESYFKRKIIKILMENLYPTSNHIIPISKGVSDDLHNSISIKKDDTTVIYNPAVSDDIYEKAKERVTHSWFQPDQSPIILGVGRLRKQKDFKTLLRSFEIVRKNRECRLIILGEGPQRQELESLAKKLNISDDIYMPGNVNNPYKYMNNSDVFVLSSAWEGFGNVVVEALACGCPVVSTDCPSGPSEILSKGEFGTLVPVGDYTEMANSIINVLDSNIEEGKLIERSEKFHPSNITDKYLKVMERACEDCQLTPDKNY